eukprot:g28923.t1
MDPMLFVIYINDVDENIEGTVSKLVDDPKVGGIVSSEEDYVDRVVKKPFGILAFIAQTFEYRSWDVMLRLYRTLVRPVMEYCVQFWSPCYRKNIIKLERVQETFSRMLPGLEGLSYKERLDRLGLSSLEHKRFRGDLIEVYKIMRDIDKANSKGLFPRWRSSKLGGIFL